MNIYGVTECWNKCAKLGFPRGEEGFSWTTIGRISMSTDKNYFAFYHLYNLEGCKIIPTELKSYNSENSPLDSSRV